jgi:hypothetical protein
MKTLIINGAKTVLKGLTRTLQQDRLDRAVFNSHRPKFLSKFYHPRRFRQGMPNLKP